MKGFTNWVGSKLSETRELSRKNLSDSFTRFGWIGFWIQIVVGVIPIILMFYSFVFTKSMTGPRAGLPIVEYLTLVGLAILVFTIYWFFRYTRIADKMKNPDTTPSETELARNVWIGLIASSIGIFFTITVMFFEVAHLLFYFLATPQGGVPVIQTTGINSASWVSAVDMLSLLSMVFTLLAELIVIMFSLWLLFRVTSGSPECGVDKAAL